MLSTTGNLRTRTTIQSCSPSKPVAGRPRRAFAAGAPLACRDGMGAQSRKTTGVADTIRVFLISL